MKLELTKAKKWYDKKSKEVRFYLVAVDENGSEHMYTRYISGNPWNPAKSWGTAKLWNGIEEGEPPAEVVSQYKSLTENGKHSWFRPENEINTYDEEDIDRRDAAYVPAPHDRPVHAQEIELA